MANLFDYLKWRGDIPLSVDPFGEVDNLVLAELAYTDFEGILDGEAAGGFLPLKEICSRYFSMHTEEEVLARETFVRKAPLLLKPLVESERFGGMQLGWYENRICVGKDEQMAAVACLLPDGTAYIAFRGTDDTIVGWKEDFNLAYMRETTGQKQAAEYLNRFRSEEMPLRVGGHSKGGNLAVYASAFCDTAVRERITEIWSNDGPGFLKEVTETPQYEAILPLVHSILPEGSLFGLLMHGKFQHHFIKSSGWGLMQHDALTWEVERNRFVKGELKDSSMVIDSALSTWIDGLELEERKSFIDTLFSVLTSTGSTTLEELGQNRLKNLGGIVNALVALDKDKKDVLGRVLGALNKSSREAVMEEMQKTRK